ncbi:hypothetical protein SKAU_G00260840 [Synaphobranchus kaupii]|uniref:Uncharacterized protein n=1 Tax=Synaphobranchus kaupii TaxID=118154 RepID=A0A9Q1F4Q4_SYNKA|nr:hypothetical protein SKAU_G00260840 [Synaphobranchus kaupii]
MMMMMMMQSAVAVVMIEMALMAATVRGAPVSLEQNPSRRGDRRVLHIMHSSAERRGEIASSDNSPERREKFLKILLSLEELHRSINSVSHRITMVSRGNKPNVRGTGKKNKVVLSEGTQRAATLPPVDHGGTASVLSDHPPEPQNQGRKDLKKSPKKPNKRVCFWKYCSQN